MSSFTLDYKLTDQFFDRANVIAKIGAANARRMSKAGAYIRRRARTDVLRRRKGTSSPGNPPSVHSRDSVATLRNIQFALDRKHESLICGPIKLNKKERDGGGGFLTVPERLEKGGPSLIFERRLLGSEKWVLAGLRSNRPLSSEYRARKVNYAARPFMGPALKKEADAGTLGSLFGSVE